MFRQVKFIVKRDINSPLFTIDIRTKIEEKIQNLLFEKEHDENALDIPSIISDHFSSRDESAVTQYNIIAPHVNIEIDLEEMKEKLNRKFRNDNITFSYEVIGGKRKSKKLKKPKKSLGKKRRSSQRKLV